MSGRARKHKAAYTAARALQRRSKALAAQKFALRNTVVLIVSLSESCCGTLRSFAGTETGRGRIGKYKKIVPAPHERASRGRQGCWRRAGLGLATNFASANHSRWRLNLCVARDAAGGRATRADGWVDAAQAVWPSSQPFHHHRALERPRRTGGRAGRPLLCSNEVGGPSVNGVERFGGSLSEGHS